MRKTLFLLLLSFQFFTVNAQGDSEKQINKNVISGNILGTASYLGLSYERFLYNRMSLEFGIGLIGIGAGINVYPYTIKLGTVRPYIGLKHTSHAIVDGPHNIVTYLPLGMTFFSNDFLNIGFDIGPSYIQHKSPGYMPTPEELAKYPYTSFGLFGNLKLGIRF